MTKNELMEMVRAAHGPITGEWFDMDIASLHRLYNAILERAAVVAENEPKNEPKTWDKDAPLPQVRAAASIRALKL